MSLPVRFSPEALADLERMHDYIAPRGGKRAATAHVARIYEHCSNIGQFPERGTRRDDIWQGLRLVGFERKATIAIEVMQHEVRIARIFGRGQDVKAELEE
jgi:toxin ParE1/3/4